MINYDEYVEMCKLLGIIPLTQAYDWWIDYETVNKMKRGEPVLFPPERFVKKAPKAIEQFKPLLYTDYEVYCDKHDRIPHHHLSSEWAWHYVYLQALVERNETLSEEEARAIVNQLITVREAAPKPPMTWAEYSKLALKTESIPVIYFPSIKGRVVGSTIQAENQRALEETRATRLMHAAAGLVTETDELRTGDSTVNWVEELGDCFWYLPIIEQCLGCTFTPNIFTYPSEVSTYTLLEHMATAAAALIDQCLKRHIIYGKELDLSIVETVTQSYVNAIYKLLEITGADPSEVWDTNIKKLKKRYPDGRFDVVATSNRDVEKELSHIPGNKNVVDFQEPVTNYEKHVVLSRNQDLDPGKLLTLEQLETLVNEMDDPVGDVIKEEEDKARKVWFDPTSNYGAQIEPHTFRGLLGNVGPFDKTVTMVGEWCRLLANDAASNGAHCLAEGYKTAYNKVMANSKPNDDFHREAWVIFNLLPGAPVAVEEVEAWLKQFR